MRSMIIPKKNIRDSCWRQRNKKAGVLQWCNIPAFFAAWRGIEDSELNSCDLAGIEDSGGPHLRLAGG